MDGWYIRHPQWFNAELDALKRAYPGFRLEEGSLREGVVVLFGELVIRPPGGARRHAVRVVFPSNSPYAFPSVTPIKEMPTFSDDGVAQSSPIEEMFDHRHQMPGGSLCLFQYETRVEDGGESISVVDVLKRAEAWFMGLATGRWPPDSRESELQTHFRHTGVEILLGKTFYSDRLRGHGEFFAVRDVHRFYVGKSQSEPPLIMTAATVSTGIYEVIDARDDLQHIFRWMMNDAWEPKAFVENQERQRKEKKVEFGDVLRVSGHWWELNAEPNIFRDGKSFLEVLSKGTDGSDAWLKVSAALGSDLTTDKIQYIGLCYPGRSGRREWLFIVVGTGVLKAQGGYGVLSEDQKRARFENAKVTCVPVHALTPQDILLRNQTVVSSTISEKSVAFFGVGALGSKAAESLAQAGLTKFKLCDGDILNVGNVARHIGGLSECGAPKTEVVARRIWEVNPYAQIEVLDEHVSPTHSATKEFFSGVDLIICTIADEGAESGFNDLAIGINTPVIYGRALRNGQMGRVFIVRPGTDACKTCLSMLSKGNDPEWISVTERPEDALLHECGRPVIAGSAVDLSFVAGFIARRALDLLEGKNLDSNHLVWSRDSAADVNERLKLPYSVAQSSFLPQQDCPSCGPSEIMTIELPEDVRTAIVTEVASSPTVETGGILIGRIESNIAIVEKATGPGPNAIRKAKHFERDIEFAQAELNAATANCSVYLGEWHSHLVPVPEPSCRDTLSMTGIAEADNYGTRCPVMMICGYDAKKATVGELRAWVFPQASSGRRVTITDGSENLIRSVVTCPSCASRPKD